MSRPKIVLIDGHSLAYRAFFALPPTLATSKGELTNAVYGFASMLLDVLENEHPDYIAVAFDVGRTFRHELFDEYKGHRAKQPDELAVQFDRIYQLVDAFDIPIFTAEGYEADDVIGTLARQAVEQGLDVVIVTGDTDAFQLIDDHTIVLTSGRRFSDVRRYDVAAVRERYGLEPHQLVDYKALVGDPSDNIPGVRGIGDKTARKLLQTYGSLDNIYAHLDDITPTRVQNALRRGRDVAFLSRELVRIRTDVPITLNLDAARTRDFDRQRVLELFRELEFNSLVGRIPPPAGQTAPMQTEEAARPVDYHIVQQSDLHALAQRLGDADFITFDVETDSLDPHTANLVGLALSVREGEGFYIPIGHSGLEGNTYNVPLDDVRALIGPFLAAQHIPARAHNAKFDLIVLQRHGFDITNVDFDTMIAAWLINPGRRTYGLKALAFDRLGVEMTPIEALIGAKKRDQRSMADVPVEDVAPYACADVDMTTRLARLLEADLRDMALWDLFTNVEMPLVPVLAAMELTGVAVDVDVLAALRNELRQRLDAIEQEIYDLVGYEFNINSSQQLSDVLFGKLGLDKRASSKTKSGHYSTSARVLENLRGAHPVVDLILEHRHLSKLLSTYIEQLPRMVNPATGRIHTDFNQTGTETGRLSSSNPNLQNIPIRTEMGRRIRRAFIAETGYVLLSADYSQIELRVLAHLSGDDALRRAFLEDGDIHRATAAAVFGVPAEQVTPEMRNLAKRVNFGLLYGMSAWRLATETGLSREEAERFLQRYFERFPSIAAFLDQIVEDARERGYTETILGRRRYFPEFRIGANVPANQLRAAERAARNHPIQGSAADIIKLAMIDIHRAFRERGLQSRMILQVHDELLFEIPEDELAEAPILVLDLMSNAYPLSVPLKVDAKVGYNWDEMVALDEFLHG
nr:DNA polymerase I [Ardenticatena sp.]